MGYSPIETRFEHKRRRLVCAGWPRLRSSVSRGTLQRLTDHLQRLTDEREPVDDREEESGEAVTEISVGRSPSIFDDDGSKYHQGHQKGRLGRRSPRLVRYGGSS